MGKVKGLRCVKCGEIYPPDSNINTCLKCDGVLDVIYDYDVMKREVSWEEIQFRRADKQGIWKYKEFLPIKSEEVMITLGEGGTPLIKSEKLNKEIGSSNLMLKAEFMNPTGSLKDRCSPVSIARALEVGAKGVCMVSSGNAGASIAAYASIAGIRSYIIVPPDTSREKILQMLLYGARVIRVRGAGSDRIKLLREACETYRLYNANAPLCPYGVEGCKTTAFEEYEQMGQEIPDWVIIPIGYANTLVGHWKGYKELYQLGYISKMPRLAAIQPEGSNSFVKAFKEGRREATPGPQNTIAGGLSTSAPLHSIKGLQAVRHSRGIAETVTDEEILNAEKLLALKAGIFAEPSGSAAVAGVIKLLKLGVINNSDRIIALVTGSGFKDIGVASSLCDVDIPKINPTIEDFGRTFKSFSK